MASLSQRFRCTNRLTKKEDFDRVFQRGCRLRDDTFTVFIFSNGLPFPRLGLAVSRRVSPGAPGRNRIKRLVRESFRKHIQRIPGLDIVVQANMKALSRPNRELFESLEMLWARSVRNAAHQTSPGGHG